MPPKVRKWIKRISYTLVVAVFIFGIIKVLAIPNIALDLGLASIDEGSQWFTPVSRTVQYPLWIILHRLTWGETGRKIGMGIVGLCLVGLITIEMTKEENNEEGE